MRRTDRLFEIIQIVRDGRLHLARDIAQVLEVSLRTVYRDIDTLVASGIPIEGERGVGYLLRDQIFLPPVNLSLVELEALHLGMAVVAQAADEELQTAAQSLLAKIDQALPNGSKPPKSWGFAVYPFVQAQAGFRHMPVIRAAIRKRQKLKISYGSLGGQQTKRVIHPLQSEYWGHVWTCTSWCELREGFRVFRIDKITECTPTGDLFSDQEGQRLTDYLGQVSQT